MLRGVILGASGAVGRVIFFILFKNKIILNQNIQELVKELCQSDRWIEVTVIVRRTLDVW